MMAVENIREILKRIFQKKNYEIHRTGEFLNGGASFMSLTSFLPDTVLCSHTLTFKPVNTFTSALQRIFPSMHQCNHIAYGHHLFWFVAFHTELVVKHFESYLRIALSSNKEHSCPPFQICFTTTLSSKKHKYNIIDFSLKMNGFHSLGQ